MSKKVLSKFILIIGTFLVLVSPFLFAYIIPLDGLKEAGTIGDTIGGITSPIVSLLGSVLIYFALSDQLEANNLLSKQIEDAKQQESIQNDLRHVSELYRLFEKNIDTFQYEQHIEKMNQSEDSNIIIFNGPIAITHFVDQLIMSDLNPHDESLYKTKSGVKEFRSIIKSAELLIDRIAESNILARDKMFYKNLIVHKIEYNLSPDFERLPASKKQYIKCNECGQDHGSFPAILFDALRDLNERAIKL